MTLVQTVDVIMNVQTRLDRILQQTAATCPSRMENGVGPIAHHQRRTKFLLSLCYTVIAILLLLLLVAENVDKILLLLNNKSSNSTLEVFSLILQMYPIKLLQLLWLCIIN